MNPGVKEVRQMDSDSQNKKQCRDVWVVCEYDVFHHAINAVNQRRA